MIYAPCISSDGSFPGEELVRAVEKAVWACRCNGPAHVAVLRAFGHASRERSRGIRRVLTEQLGLVIHDEPVPVVADDRPLSHVCCYVDAAGTGEVRRVAALTGTPLIRFEQGAGQPDVVIRTPLLRLRRDGEPLPPAAGLVIDVAFDEVSVAPNRPELGDLTLRIGDDQPWHYLPPGATVHAALLPETILVRACVPSGFDAHWFTARLAVRRIDGLFPVTCDGVRINNLDGTLEVHHDTASLLERVVPLEACELATGGPARA